MEGKYLNVKLVSSLQDEKLAESGAHLNLIVAQDHLGEMNNSDSVRKSIEAAFEKKESKVITTNGDQLKLTVVIPVTELEDLRLAGALAYKALKNEQTREVKVDDLQELTAPEKYAFLEGLILSSYHFDKYKTKKNEATISVFCSSEFVDEKSLTELNLLSQAVALTKNLVNEPPQYMDSVRFSEYAVAAGKQYGFETKILQKAEIEELKMGGLLAVNQGSSTPPTFNTFHYKPENAVNEKPLVLVGKGVTFDTGGYSIKVGGNMTSMKSDMAGGAAVVGIISAAAANKLPYHIIGLVPATDNKISSDALVVDDIITMMDGTTVEVQNTDAEGRLVLADALTYAKRFHPELVIDMATLTGASAAITGSLGIAMAGNNEDQMAHLKISGEEMHERLLQLPFWKEFEELLKSDIADLKNIGGPVGGASTAGKFLEHFTDYPWIHLDIAGAAFVNDAKGYRQSGATGVAVRLVYDFIKRKCN